MKRARPRRDEVVGMKARRTVMSPLFCLPPDLVLVFDAHIKLSRDFAKTFAEARSPIIYNCRTSQDSAENG